MPLCMGIAIASGVPPEKGLITGIIGGLVVGALAGSPLQVSGPAAGLAVIVFELVRDQGLSALGPILMLAGLIQVVAGVFRLGGWFRAISPAVVHGMLAGIGVLIVIGQFHVLFDSQAAAQRSRESRGDARPPARPVAQHGGGGNRARARAGDDRRHARLGEMAAAGAQARPRRAGGRDGEHTCSPSRSASTSPAWSCRRISPRPSHCPMRAPSRILLNPSVIGAAFAIAFIASAETLLSAAAVDRMHDGVRTNYNKELRAQGVGNLLCGAAGALPMTGVIVRSSANVQAGATTRLSTILHGVWILGFVALLPWLLREIPMAALGGGAGRHRRGGWSA